jgi:hypothetical protein
MQQMLRRRVPAMLKWWFLFLWATCLFFAAEWNDLSPEGNPPTWDVDGLMAIGCIFAFAALLSAIIPG